MNWRIFVQMTSPFNYVGVITHPTREQLGDKTLCVLIKMSDGTSYIRCGNCPVRFYADAHRNQMTQHSKYCSLYGDMRNNFEFVEFVRQIKSAHLLPLLYKHTTAMTNSLDILKAILKYYDDYPNNRDGNIKWRKLFNIVTGKYIHRVEGATPNYRVINYPEDINVIYDDSSLRSNEQQSSDEELQPVEAKCVQDIPAPVETKDIPAPVETPAELQCCVCMHLEKNTVFFPCAHCCACTSCSDKLARCPICRATITSKVTIYIQ